MQEVPSIEKDGSAPNGATKRNWSVFISSFTAELSAERRQIHQMCLERDLSAFIAEECRKDLNPTNREPLEIVDALLEEIREASGYVCIFAGARQGEEEHGTSVWVGDKRSRVSYFELELFQAALLGKPIRIFVATDFVPGKRLAALLRILEASFPPEMWVKRVPKSEIPAQVVAFVKKPKFFRYSHPVFLEQLYQARGRTEIEFRFLNGEFEEGSGLPDKELIGDLLVRCDRSQNYERKIARLWLIIRELMTVPADSMEFMPLWNVALGLWAKTGSWYRLHGHLYLGSLAALFEQRRIRLRLREHGGFRDSELSYPGVPLASSLYSLAKRIRNRSTRMEIFSQAEKEAHLALNEKKDNDAALAVLGSIYLKTYRFSAAVDAYSKVLKMRENGTNEAALGEALAEYGFGLLFQGRLWKGRSYIREGVQILARTGSPGFLIRARKKLAVAYLMTGHPIKWRTENELARLLAEENKLLDQL